MAAPKKNEFWKVRSKHGRDKIFADAKTLWEESCKYFEWCQNNPLKDPRSFGQRSIARPFTIQGLCRYLGVNSTYLWDFKKSIEGKKDKDSKDFSNIIKDIEGTIYQQKFENAVIGVYKDNIIARDLGLVDKKELDNKNAPQEIIIKGQKFASKG